MLIICSFCFLVKEEVPPHPRSPLPIVLMSSPNEQSISDIEEVQKGAVTEFYKVLEDTKALISPLPQVC